MFMDWLARLFDQLFPHREASSVSVGDLATWYAAIVATAALALEVRRWRESGARLTLSVMPEAETYGSLIPDDSTYLVVTVSNRGAAPTTITHFALLEFKGAWSRFRRRSARSAIVNTVVMPLPHNIAPGALWTGMARHTEELARWIDSGRLYVAIYATHSDKPDILRVVKRPIPSNNNSNI